MAFCQTPGEVAIVTLTPNPVSGILCVPWPSHWEQNLAAEHMSEATGVDTKTNHRQLEVESHER